MRDVTIVTAVYCVLFVILTTPVGFAIGSLSAETVGRVHHFLAELVFWVAAVYICASSTMGVFARQDRFGLSHKHPLLNRVLSVLLLLSPVLAVFVNVRFVFLMLGLLAFSHLKSKTDEEAQIEFSKSRAFSNLILIVMFTVAMMLMNMNGNRVTSIFNFGATKAPVTVEENSGNA